MMERSRIRQVISISGVLAAAILGKGCQSTPEAAAPASAATDPCAERLHALCGPLLLYHALHGRLPDRLEELQALADPGETFFFECPASGKSYLYMKEGVAIPGQQGLVIVRDPLPSDSGILWAIALLKAGSSQPLNTRVIALTKWIDEGAR
jgi:hypothetical protein